MLDISLLWYTFTEVVVVSFDGIMLRAVSGEIEDAILGRRIDRVDQPSECEVSVIIRGESRRDIQLFISCAPQIARIHISTTQRQRPQEPSPFCMLMRKYLEGGRVISVEQDGLDRVIRISVSSPLEEEGKFSIIVAELMGNQSNIILLDGVSRVVLGTARRTVPKANRKRQVLPGEQYLPPPAARKDNPLSVSGEEFCRGLLEPGALGAKSVYEYLLARHEGLGPTACREIVFRAGVPAELPVGRLDREEIRRLWDAFSEIVSCVRAKEFVPVAYVNEASGEVEDFSWTKLHMHAAGAGIKEQVFGSFGELLDFVYDELTRRMRLESLRGSLSRLVRDHLDRVRRKVEARRSALADAERGEDYRIMGELILANIHSIPRGAAEITVKNYYDPEQGYITIPLDPKLSPAQSAQQYFARYRKAKNGLRITQQLLAEAESEEAYLDQVSLTIAEADTLETLNEIREELIKTGYLKEKKHLLRQAPRTPRGDEESRRPMEFRSPDGTRILVGRNNLENDYLTLKMAKPDDIWLHARGIPGAHVIVTASDDGQVGEEALLMGARLAARFSKAKGADKVPVDYTRRRFVKKPRAARPGMVVYEKEKTILVSPMNVQDSRPV
ncbi:MAG TPA: fibronectin/fibrinogen-binding protein [Firmicutes bacterium]|nr:fibronectin/fibrinogen-binding protein [Bacillota bacterium]